MSDARDPRAAVSYAGVPYATVALIGASLASFLGILAQGGSLFLVAPGVLSATGAVDAPLVWQGEIWRLVSALFVHAGIWHVGLNMMVLWQVGRVLERVLGTARFVLLYVVSGVVGFAASLLLHPGLSAGASGAIFGEVGGLLALAAATRGSPLGRHLARALAPFVVVTLVIGWFVPFVDNAAHVGGLCAGFLLAYGLFADEKGARLDELGKAGMLLEGEVVEMRPRFGGVALVLAAITFAVVVPLALKPWFSPRYHSALGFSAVRSGDVEGARAHLARAEAAAAEDAAVLLLRGRVYLDGEAPERARAREFLREALATYDEEPELAFMLAARDAGLYDGEEALFGDVRLAHGLCDVLLGGAQRAPPLLLNNCAWLALKAEDPLVHDAARGLALAQRAVALGRDRSSRGELAAMLHTLAEAHAQNGDAKEARIILERVLADGMSNDPRYLDDYQRFRGLAQAAAAGARAEGVGESGGK